MPILRKYINVVTNSIKITCYYSFFNIPYSSYLISFWSQIDLVPLKGQNDGLNKFIYDFYLRYKMFVKLLSKIITVIEHPILLKTINNKINRRFVKDLIFVKEKLMLIPNTIIDIGGAIGEWSLAANLVFPNSKLYFFEPITESFNIAKKRLSHLNNVKFFNYALSSNNGNAKFYLNEFSFSSSLLRMTEKHKKIFPFTKNESEIVVETNRLDTINGIELIKPVYIKMDVQGAELRVLEGAGELIEKFDAIQLEVNFENFYYGQAEYDKIFSFMLSNEFIRFVQIDSLYSKGGCLLASDLIFLR